MATPRQLIEQLEANVSLPAGNDERFNGYGIMGLPFESGHVLAMRRFPASSVGEGYTSVWHRDPAGNWTFYADTPPQLACTRYFGATASNAIETDIHLKWLTPNRLKITMPAYNFEWTATAGATTPTRLMNAAGRLLPDSAWQNKTILSLMSKVAGSLLGVGRVGLQGTVPNGQSFIANPRTLWVITASQAQLAGEAFGAPGAVHPQAHLGDFWIPQRGMLAIGQAYFDTFDPAHHSVKTSLLSL